MAIAMVLPVTSHIFDDLAGQGVAFVSGFADSFDRALIRSQFTLVALFKKVAHALFDGGVRRDGLQAAKIPAVTAFAQRIDLNMTYLADVAVTTDKMRPLEMIPAPVPRWTRTRIESSQS